MALSYASPGVYVEEVDRGTKPIQAVGTSTAAFIGISAEASVKAINAATGQKVAVESRLNKATLVTNWTQFVDIFGDFTPGAFMPDAVYGYFANGGGPCYITSLRALKEGDSGSSFAEVVIPSKGKTPSFKVVAKSAGPLSLSIAVKIGENETFSLIVGGQTIAGLTMKKGENFVGDVALDTIKITDVGAPASFPEEGTYSLTGGGIRPLSAADFIGDPGSRTGLGGLEAIDEIRLVLAPDVMAGYDGSKDSAERIRAIQAAIIAHCEKLRYRFAILDTPPGLNPQQAKDWRNFVNFDTSYAALYYPWVAVADLTGSGGLTRMVPPSGLVAGVYNRMDADRGVHKAPANEILLGAVDLEIKISKGEQDILNPLGINCIRTFPARGLRIWGARTLSSNGSWRYINVRRLFIMVEASMEAGLSWVVFEPNDSTLWAKVNRDVTSFLRIVWRSGALFGTTPEQAFYVKCDEELNPPEVRDLGQLIIEVGMSPVKPAEFVIFRISQWAGANAQK